MLAIIPARGGSKGVPRKNIKSLAGKPLIQYTIEAAREVFDDENILVSTDDEEIKQAAEATGLKVPFLRPKDLATDSSSTRDVVLHAVKYMESLGRNYDTLVLLQPTSPFRTSQHIHEAIKTYLASKDVDMVTSVKETKANPYYLLKEENAEGYLESSKEASFTRRQDCPKVWELNGAVYVMNIDRLKESPTREFKKVKKYVMDEVSSHDIDEQFDWELAEFLISSGYVKRNTNYRNENS